MRGAHFLAEINWYPSCHPHKGHQHTRVRARIQRRERLGSGEEVLETHRGWMVAFM